MEPRKCAGCGKGKSVWVIDWADWHRDCWKRATPEERAKAREEAKGKVKGLKVD